MHDNIKNIKNKIILTVSVLITANMALVASFNVNIMY